MASVSSASAPTRLLVGAYTADSGEGGHAAGISLASLDADGSIGGVVPLAAADSPSFLATHPTLPVVYAAHEFAKTVTAWQRAETGSGDEDAVRLQPLGGPWEAGEAVCHVSVSSDGRYAVATCWGDGRVLLYDLDSDGAILGRMQAEDSVDSHADRAAAEGAGVRIGTGEVPRQSRAHSSLQLPDGRILTTDLGHDTVRIWCVEPGAEQGAGLQLVADGEIVLPYGSGPRHMAVHPSGHVYVITEYSNEVFVIDPDAVRIVSVSRALAAGAHDGDSGAHLSLDGWGHVHTTVRGANAVGVLEVADAGARLVPVADVPCGGVWPRHHLQTGDRLYVANQLSDDIAVFRLGSDGIPSLEATVSAGSPTCLVPVP